MRPLTITCESCDHRWEVASPHSVYEQQALESCPCPDCGAYTLCCPDAAEPASVKRPAAAGKPW